MTHPRLWPQCFGQLHDHRRIHAPAVCVHERMRGEFDACAGRAADAGLLSRVDLEALHGAGGQRRTQFAQAAIVRALEGDAHASVGGHSALVGIALERMSFPAPLHMDQIARNTMRRQILMHNIGTCG